MTLKEIEQAVEGTEKYGVVQMGHREPDSWYDVAKVLLKFIKKEEGYMTAPSLIWVNTEDNEDSCCPVESDLSDVGKLFCLDTATSYIRADLVDGLIAEAVTKEAALWVAGNIMVDIGYSRFGMARPAYAANGMLFGSVSEVCLAYAQYPVAKSVIIKACADARDVGVGHFLYKKPVGNIGADSRGGNVK